MVWRENEAQGFGSMQDFPSRAVGRMRTLTGRVRGFLLVFTQVLPAFQVQESLHRKGGAKLRGQGS